MILRFLNFVALVVPFVASQTCTLCTDGTNPSVIPNNSVALQTCPQVIALLPQITTASACADTQSQFGNLCGCLGSSAFTCDVCPNGGATNPFGDANNRTCAAIEIAAALATDDQQCSDSLAPFWNRTNITEVCGCPGVPQPCSLCPGGATPGNPSLSLGQQLTCANFDASLRLAGPDPNCGLIHEKGYPIVCGCPGFENQKPCSICDGGDTRGSPRDPAAAGYCTNLDNRALNTSVTSCDGNTNAYDQWLCGCPNAVPDCPLCESTGQSPNYDQASNFSTVGGSCLVDQVFLQNIVQLDCTAAQGTVGQVCGCNNPNAAASVCLICTDHALPDPNKMVPSFGHSCGFIEYFATAQNNAGSKSCTFYRGEYVATCCEGAPDPYPPRPSGPSSQAPIGFPPIAAPVPAPVAPISAPVAPIPAPVAPISAPVAPIPAPVAPIPAPVAPISAPVAPISAPVAPTSAPVAPIPAPVAPIPAPVAPISAPVAPIPAPTAPISAPVAPIPAPTAPTPAPVAPTAGSSPAPVTSAPIAGTSAPISDTSAPVKPAPVTSAPVKPPVVSPAPTTNSSNPVPTSEPAGNGTSSPPTPTNPPLTSGAATLWSMWTGVAVMFFAIFVN